MPRFAANLTMMFNEVDFTERFAAAARAGFRAVEYLFPYAYEGNRLADLLARYGPTQALFNLPAGDWAAGDRGIARCLTEPANSAMGSARPSSTPGASAAGS